MYSTSSMLRTMELILGVKPMSQFDAAARPMYASFQAKPDLGGYEHGGAGGEHAGEEQADGVGSEAIGTVRPEQGRPGRRSAVQRGDLAIGEGAEVADAGPGARGVLRSPCEEGQRLTHGSRRQRVAGLVPAAANGSKAVIAPRQLDASLLWKRMGVRKSMPPRKVKERPSDADLETVRKWIVAGAPAYPQPVARAFLSTEKVLTRLRDHLRAADRDKRRHLRTSRCTTCTTIPPSATPTCASSAPPCPRRSTA